MKIAQVAPLYESVPPELYGGTERIVAYLTDELVERGHDVTLFASGDSHTRAKLVPVIPKAIRLDNSLNTLVKEPHCYQMLELGKVFERAGEFDVIHCHVEYFALPFTRLIKTPIVNTLHGRLDMPELQPIFREYSDANLVSISNNQRKPFPFANWLATVYHGIDVTSFTLERRRGSYLAFLGRIAPEKGIEQAIAVAKLTGIPLKVAAKVDPADEDYYQHRVKPLLDHHLVEFVGEIGQHEKNDFLGGAMALLFPIRWPEPFGLVVIEALACGRPVIAGRFGSVQELVLDHKTGFICDSVEEMALACQRLGEISSITCRNQVESRFSAEVMAGEYEAVYARLVHDRKRLTTKH